MHPKNDILPFQKENYEDYASGRVIYGMPGTTAFPVRLATETFQRAVTMLRAKGAKPPYTVYDPFCGGAYLLTVLGFLYGRQIARLFASDIDAEVLSLAAKNLSLLSQDGLERRMHEIHEMISSFHKESHQGALESAKRLQQMLTEIGHTVGTTSFVANAIGDDLVAHGVSGIDLVMTDLPYGQLTQWKGQSGEAEPTQAFLTNLKTVLKPSAIVCVSSHKRLPIAHDGYLRLKSLKQVQRKVLFLELEK